MQKEPIKPVKVKTTMINRQRSQRKPGLWDKFKNLLGFSPLDKDKFAKKLLSMLKNYEPWVIEYIKFSDSSLEISGCAINDFWSKYYEIIDIIPGYTNTNLQDLVVRG